MIEGFFESRSRPDSAPYVLASVVLSGLGRWGLMPLLVDTGAARTVIHPRDAKELLGIDEDLLRSPPPAWGEPLTGQGVGGGGQYFEFTGTIGFTDGAGAPVTFPLVFGLAPLTPVSGTLPSLLGRDVLQHFELTTNWPKRIVRLERA